MKRDRLDLLLRIARRYYEDNANQQQIADEEHISRPTVSRLLDEARAVGVVTIRVAHPLRRQLELETQLRERYSLAGVWVSDLASDDEMDTLTATARVAAHVLADTVRPDSIVAISNGSTLAAVVDAFAAMSAKRHRDTTVVQMIGGLGQTNTLDDSPDLCRKLAGALGGRHRDMPVPLVVTSDHLAGALRRESTIEMTLQLASHADLALVGIGVSGPHGSGQIFDGWMSGQIAAQLHGRGAVGHIAGHHFDSSGRHVESDLCRRTIGVSLERLRDMAQVVGVAAGVEKTMAIHGALTGGYVKTLVIDAAAARAVLQLRA